MRQKLFFIILALSTFLYAEAYDFQSGGLYYKITSNSEPYTVEVTYQDLPDNYSGKTTITIPETVTYNEQAYSVTSIGYGAFEFCNDLTSVTIPNSVTSIGESAFSNCKGLTSITIPNSVTSIGDGAFNECSGLTSIDVDSDNSNFTFVDGVLFNKDKTILICCLAGKTGSYTIPNSVTSIGDWAFYDCSGLTSVTIPNSVTSIGSYAFEYCSGLTSVTIPNSVTSIDGNAFFGCRGLTSVTIPNTVKSIGDRAFYNVKHIDYNGNATGSPWGAISMNGIIDGDFVYSDADKKNLIAYIGAGGEITIPNSVTSIGNYAFAYCYGLTSVTIPNSVTSIGKYAFLDCSGLTSVTIPNSVTSIDGFVFLNCSGLTSLTIPNSVTSIGDYAFKGCSGLKSVTIPNSVTSIGAWAFELCSSLNSVKVNWEEPLSISSGVFETLSGISLYVPNSVKEKYEAASVWKKFNIIGVEIYEVKLSAENGTVTGSGIYLENTTVGIEAIPAEDYHFVRWSDENTENPREITVTEDLELEAIFEKDVPTAIKAVESENDGKTIKTIKDGQIVIIRNGVMYDMNGRKK